MNRWISPHAPSLALFALFALLSCDHHHEAPPPAPAGVNPVQHEMRLLHEAMRDTVTAIANGDVKTVPAALHRVHAAKEVTENAIKTGAWHPPKNGQALERFLQLDGTFHGELEFLVESAAKGDIPTTAIAMGKALASCNGCHAEFRK